MIYFFQRSFGDNPKKVLRASIYWYFLLWIIVKVVVAIIYDDPRPEYGEFFRTWTTVCCGMVIMLIAILEFGLTLVIVIGSEKTILNSIPSMLPQCLMLLCVVLINVLIFGNPSQFRHLRMDMTRVRQNEPMEEEVTQFCVVRMIHSRSRHKTTYDYYLEFGDKRAELTEKKYTVIYEMIGGIDDPGYRNLSPPGPYRVQYLPNSMVVLEVSKVEDVRKFP